MSNFDSTKISLRTILEEIVSGKIQLPDFQRGWVWDDEHIRSLLVSIGRSFPIGSVMLLETGGQARFQERAVEGITLPSNNIKAERLILDGQQRLTSLTQVLRLPHAIKTRNAKNQDVTRYYYINIEKALMGNGNLEEAIIGVDENKQLKSNFGRDIELDLSTLEKEFETFHFPCNQILNSDVWEEGLMDYNSQKFPRYMKFRAEILNKFRAYDIPVIELNKENSKEAVCLVFEKVNTGGVPLSVFELMTATYSADGFNLRDDWYGVPTKSVKGRKDRLYAYDLLKSLEPTDFLQGLSLLNTYEAHIKDKATKTNPKEITAVSAKRDQVLALPLSAYQQWADKLCEGFISVERYLRMQGFRKIDYLPYRSQLVPFACVMVLIGDRWLQPVIQDKLTRWFWCGVFGEQYGGSIETRIGLDLQDLMAWIDDPKAPEPSTIISAGFQASRLDTLRSRTSAAYRGLYVLLQREKSRDFFWKVEITSLDYNEIDIHHIFPKDWCKAQGIPDRVYNSIINKTAISYKANRMIGGAAPSRYLEKLRTAKEVMLSVAEQDEILISHLIDPEDMKVDNFETFYKNRKQRLIQIIEKAMGKPIISVADDNQVVVSEIDEDE